MPRAKTNSPPAARRRKLAASLRKLVAETMLKHGGVLTVGTFDPSRDEYNVDTPAGKLIVILYATETAPWIPQRFDEPQRALAIIRDGMRQHINPHSGKWNYHFTFEQGEDYFLAQVAGWLSSFEELMAWGK